MDEDTTGKETVAHLVRRRAPLRRENSESTSDTSRKMTPLALRGRLMPRRREGRPPPAAPPCIRPCVKVSVFYMFYAISQSFLKIST